MKTSFGSYSLERIPKTKKGDLRAWDAADEFLLETVFSQYINHLTDNKDSPLLIINDSFGALTIGLTRYKVHNWTDSYLAHLAAQHNITLNQLENNALLIPSTEKLKTTYKFVLIKIPKTLSLLEEQLCQLKSHIDEQTIIIAAAMSKHIHTSTLKLFEKVIGTTTTSRAVKKARLAFIKNDQQQTCESPYPKVIHDQQFDLHLSNHANVFAKDHLDIGTRFFIEQLKKCPASKHIIDLGCGNGALGIIAKRYQKDAHIHFVDESYMAIASAKENYSKEKMDNASFYISTCLDQYDGKKPDLILCNPPFHQAHSVGDQIAWQMFQQSHKTLQKNGELWVIGNRHLAYHAKLKRLFGNCKTIASNKKFVVLAAKNM